jgi:adenylosuccinate synthase
MLIDAEYGFYLFISWTDCTSSNAMADLKVIAPHAEIHTIGVMRCYSVRHGSRSLPAADPCLVPLMVDHNQSNPWQGSVRYS